MAENPTPYSWFGYSSLDYTPEKPLQKLFRGRWVSVVEWRKLVRESSWNVPEPLPMLIRLLVKQIGLVLKLPVWSAYRWKSLT